ncbi:(d)CMP kinase [Clostridium sp. D2Q-11]|uniref:Cytidylate kinase n=1 Tax=Anaeromonas frigoriresistens TaxID=2683708 RepID=A0A942V136_9FIRM|nr:(d)CMP kinase [Anaeromonas frigoriresistens]MBS4539941.1 (d)CMP kinase [Anaeromonas frigoriresistens]
MSNLVIAVDGPAGAGKSTIAKLIASKLNIIYIDTGAMYRALTYKLINENIDLKDISKIIDVLKDTEIDFKNNHIYLDGKIVDDKIRTNDISNNVSIVARIKEVREKLVNIQRKISKNNDVIMDGRDIASHVLPDANLKFYINATPKERGKRRYEEIIKRDPSVSLSDIIQEVKVRDEIDSTREISPLIKTKDAIEIDTTDKSIEEVVQVLLDYIKDNIN